VTGVAVNGISVLDFIQDLVSQIMMGTHLTWIDPRKLGSLRDRSHSCDVHGFEEIVLCSVDVLSL